MMLDVFMEQYTAAPFEYINGKQKPYLPEIARHVLTVRNITRVLYDAGNARQAGSVYSHALFVRMTDVKQVNAAYVPDVMFYAQDRFDAYKQQTPDWRDKPFVLVPDLAVEVVSPNDRYTDLNAKVQAYLRDGVRLVWVIDPQTRSATVYTGDAIQLLSETDTITGGAVLPEFTVSLGDLLPDPDA